MKLANRLLAPVNTTVISILGIGQLLMGLWLTLPFNSLADYHLNCPPEWLVGVVLIVIGFFTSRSSLKTDLKNLQYVTLVAYIFWITAMIVMLVTNAIGMGWIVGLIFATYCFMINLNIRANRR